MSKQDEWRALADRLLGKVLTADARYGPVGVQVDASIPHIGLMRASEAALRDAADRLDAVQRYAQGQAISEHALGHSAEERDWLDLLAVLTTPTDQEASK